MAVLPAFLGLGVAIGLGLATASPAAERPGDVQMQDALTSYRLGNLVEAASGWRRAAGQYAAEARPGLEAEALALAAQARGALGFLRESQVLLERALEVATPTGDAERIGAILGALARSYVDLGDSRLAETTLEQALQRAQEAEAPGLEAALLLSRGDLLTSLGDAAGAAAVYGRSEQLAAGAGDEQLAVQAAANAARASIDAGRSEGVRGALATVLQRAESLPDSDAKAQVIVQAARSYERLAELDRSQKADLTRTAAVAYAAAIGAAERTGAQRSASYALGYLGGLHERAGRTDDALVLTRRAVAAAQAADARESLFRWHWQIGRLLSVRGETAASLAAYRRAVRTLEDVRGVNGGAGLAFETSVEPVYLGLVDLLLQEVAANADSDRRSTLLAEAQDRLEELKAAELRDYFHDACLAP